MNPRTQHKADTLPLPTLSSTHLTLPIHHHLGMRSEPQQVALGLQHFGSMHGACDTILPWLPGGDYGIGSGEVEVEAVCFTGHCGMLSRSMM